MSEATPTRDEHLAWCKQRALAYLPSSPTDAFASMTSDLNKHDDTRNHSGMELGLMLMLSGHLNDPAEMRRFIEGFN